MGGDDSPHAGDDSSEHSVLFSQVKWFEQGLCNKKCTTSSVSGGGHLLQNLRVNQGDRGTGVCLEWCIAADFSFAACPQEFSLSAKSSVKLKPLAKPARSVKTTPASESVPPPTAVRTIKKYPNRRLYDTQTSSYVTLAELKKLVMASSPLQVLDAKTGEDLTVKFNINFN